MCKRLTETAAGDLLAFVRKVRREETNCATADFRSAVLSDLAGSASRLLDKHGLLTMADDPKVARVFMDDDPWRWYQEVNPSPRSVSGSTARFADGPHPISCGSPARTSYVESGQMPRHAVDAVNHGYDQECAASEGFTEGERVTLVCVGGLATDPDLDPGTPAEGQRIAHGAQGVVDCAGTHNVGVVWDGYEGSVRVPASMLRRV